jgi:CDGSH-type Zn-finger protein
MARLVKHERNGPYEIPEGTELPVYICGCGLSKNKPFCDGSHKRTLDEQAGETYVYDQSGRVAVSVDWWKSS